MTPHSLEIPVFFPV